MYQLDRIANAFFQGVYTGVSHGAIQVCCPFHHDTHPSLHIYADGYWKCYPCDRGGTLFHLIASLCGCNDLQAAFLLANYHDVQEEEDSHQKEIRASDMQLAQDIWQGKERKGVVSNFFTPETYVHHYLYIRGYLADTLHKYRIASINCKRYPLFIPLAFNSEVFGYMLRTTDRHITPKYNTMTGLCKSNYLYGYARKGFPIFITEGRLDGMMAAQYGWRDEVSILGSALSEQQEKLLRDLCPPNIVCGFDNDERGEYCYEDMRKRMGREIPIQRFRFPGKDIAACSYQQFLRAWKNSCKNVSSF